MSITFISGRVALKSHSKKRRGTIAIMAAFFLIIVISFLAFTVDFGHINVSESEMQNAADAGAFSGARALGLSRADARTQAKAWASRNKSTNQFVNVQDSDVEIGIWNKATATFTALPDNSSTSPNAVKVTCQRTKARGNPLPLFLGPILGTNNADVKVSAVASVLSGTCGDIIALNRIYLNNRNRISYTDAFDSSIAPYSAGSAPTGDVCTNGHITLNGSSAINGKASRWVNSSEPRLTGPVTGGITTFPDYLTFPNVNVGDAATNNNNGSLPPGVLSGGRFSLGSTNNPGAKGQSGYMSLSTGTPKSLTLQPGTYYFQEMAVGSKSTIIVTGPTRIYVAGQIDLSYGQINNTSMRPIDLQIYPFNGVDSQYAFHLPTYGDLYAVIYAPHVDIFSNLGVPYTLEFYGKMVGQLIRIWSTALHVDESVKFGDLVSGGEQTSSTGATGNGVSLVQ